VARTPMLPAQAAFAVDGINEGSLQWRLIDSSVGPPARVAHAQAVYDDKIVFVFGGRAGITMQEKAMNDLWKLDCSGPPGTEKWSLVTPDLEKGDAPPEERSFHKMLCIDSDLYVFGGCSADHGRLADLHKFNIHTNAWQNLGASAHLRGRGGASLLTFSSGKMLGVVAGFCGEESNDGHCFHLDSQKWDVALMPQLENLRPRSVCVSGSMPSTGLSVIFGGEVDPSANGHEGAGDFENDIVLLDESSGKYLGSTACDKTSSDPWPETRGWSDGASRDDGNGMGQLFLFGGLAGNDASPLRLDDLWRLDVDST
jgi:hypothetical protein